MTLKTYFSPAKINWFVHVTGRRDDGYHLLETAFQRINWMDEIRISTRRDGQIQLEGDLSGVTQEKNLAFRAATALKAAAESLGLPVDQLGADIQLSKSIPAGAGLGGGSSNAATVLLALNALWDLQLSSEDLQRIGLTLGADVPFFVSEMPAAFASGVGERLQPLDLPERRLLLVNPNVHINTGLVFTHEALPRQHVQISSSLSELQATLQDAPINDAHGNDLEAVTFLLSDEVKRVYNELSPLAATRMSGSGATIMACPQNESEHAALALWSKTCPAQWQWRWVSTINH